MTECSDRNCQRKLDRVYSGIFGKDEIWDMVHNQKKDIDDVKDRQTEWTIVIDSKMPKAWLWRLILVVAPVTGIAMTILIFQATADAKFAKKDDVTRHDEKICAIEKNMKNQGEKDAELMRVLGEILKAVRKE